MKFQLNEMLTDITKISDLADTSGYSIELTNACQAILDRRQPQLTTIHPESVGIMSGEFVQHYTPVVDFLAQCINDKKLICVAYDYDCDGITAGVCLTQTLKLLNANYTSCVPDKIKDGYGLSVRAVKEVAPEPCVVITVDNGITSRDAAKQLTDEGYIIIITDHHMQEGDLPVAKYIINPKLYCTEQDDEYMGSGCYVAAKLSMNLMKKYHTYDNTPNLGEGNYHTNYRCSRKSPLYRMYRLACCLTGISIVSDVIPLNRTMSAQLQLALSELPLIEHAGLRALIEMCGFGANIPITSTIIAFYIAPRINSAGRIGDPKDAFNLLSHWDMSQGMSMAQTEAAKLRALNSTRKIMEQTVFEEADLTRADNDDVDGIVLFNENWHPGVVGIVASRIVEKTNKPCILLTKQHDGDVTGSGRAPADCDLLSLLVECKEYLVKFGGHKVACGVSLKRENVDAFIAAFNNAAKKYESTEVTVKYDGVVTIPVIQDIRFKEFLNLFQPTGNANPNIVMRINNVRITKVERLDMKLKLVVIDSEGRGLQLSKFRPPVEWEFEEGQVIDVLCSISTSYYRGVVNHDYNIEGYQVIQEKK